MSQHGNYCDNLRDEFMRNRFKTEVLDSGHFFGLSEAKFETIYYQYQAYHFTLGYYSPNRLNHVSILSSLARPH